MSGDSAVIETTTTNSPREIFGRVETHGMGIANIIAAALDTSSTARPIPKNAILDAVIGFLALQTALPGYPGLSPSHLGVCANAYAVGADLYRYVKAVFGDISSDFASALQTPDNALLSNALLHIEKHSASNEPLMAATIYGLSHRPEKAPSLLETRKKELLAKIVDFLPDFGNKSRTIREGAFYRENTPKITSQAVRNASLAAIVAYIEAKNLGDEDTARLAHDKLLAIASNITSCDNDKYLQYYATIIGALKDGIRLYHSPEDRRTDNKVADLVGLMGEIAYSAKTQERIYPIYSKPSDSDEARDLPLIKNLIDLPIPILLKYITYKPQGAEKDPIFVSLVEAVVLGRSMDPEFRVGNIKGMMEQIQNAGLPKESKIAIIVMTLLRGLPGASARILSIIDMANSLEIAKEAGKNPNDFFYGQLSRGLQSTLDLNVVPRIPINTKLNQYLMHMKQVIGLIKTAQDAVIKPKDAQVTDDKKEPTNQGIDSKIIPELKTAFDKVKRFVSNLQPGIDDKEIKQMIGVLACMLPDRGFFSGLNEVQALYKDMARYFANYALNYAIREFHGVEFITPILDSLFRFADVDLVMEVIKEFETMITTDPSIFVNNPEKIRDLIYSISSSRDTDSARTEQEKNDINEAVKEMLRSILLKVVDPSTETPTTGIAQRLLDLADTPLPDEGNKLMANETVIEGYRDQYIDNYRKLQKFRNSLYKDNSFMTMVRLCREYGLDMGTLLIDDKFKQFLRDDISIIDSEAADADELKIVTQIYEHISGVLAEQSVIKITDTDSVTRYVQAQIESLVNLVVKLNSSSKPESQVVLAAGSDSNNEFIERLSKAITASIRNGTADTLSQQLGESSREIISGLFSTTRNNLNNREIYRLLARQALMARVRRFELAFKNLFPNSNNSASRLNQLSQIIFSGVSKA